MRSTDRTRALLASRQGYMLLDVLAALTFFSVALVGLVPLLITTTRAVHQGERTSAAATIARDKLEEIRALPFANVTSGEDSVADGYQTYARRWVVGNGPVADTLAVEVTVDWQDLRPHSLAFETVIAE